MILWSHHRYSGTASIYMSHTEAAAVDASVEEVLLFFGLLPYRAPGNARLSIQMSTVGMPVNLFVESTDADGLLEEQLTFMMLNGGGRRLFRSQTAPKGLCSSEGGGCQVTTFRMDAMIFVVIKAKPIYAKMVVTCICSRPITLFGTLSILI